MGVEEGEEDKIVADGEVLSVEGGTLHGRQLTEGMVSVQVLKSYDNDYVLYQPITLDDPPVTKIGEAVLHWIAWPTEFLRHLECFL